MNDIRVALVNLVQYARQQPEVETLEIEFRISVDPALFYERFASMAAVPGAQSRYTRSVTLTESRGPFRVRTEFCPTGRCVIESLVKQRLTKPSDFQTRHGRLRLDIHSEWPTDSATRAGHSRRKERVSLSFQMAPHWRLDFTRVLAAEGGVETTVYEIELELDNAALGGHPTADDLASEAVQLLHLSLFR